MNLPPIDYRGLPVVALVAGLTYTVIAPILGLPVPSIEVVVIGFPTMYGAAYWLVHGAGLWATLSWTVPLAAWLSFCHFLVPMPAKVVGVLLGIVIVYLMTASDTASTWWTERFGRRRN